MEFGDRESISNNSRTIGTFTKNKFHTNNHNIVTTKRINIIGIKVLTIITNNQNIINIVFWLLGHNNIINIVFWLLGNNNIIWKL